MLSYHNYIAYVREDFSPKKPEVLKGSSKFGCTPELFGHFLAIYLVDISPVMNNRVKLMSTNLLISEAPQVRDQGKVSLRIYR